MKKFPFSLYRPAQTSMTANGDVSVRGYFKSHNVVSPRHCFMFSSPFTLFLQRHITDAMS
jgi:hypothetical protein